ncbi:MAG: flagellar basal-body rod protein FlgF [Alphaproteobacteria bacterium]|jgi:flagellar basal-body rod protein FlgF
MDNTLYASLAGQTALKRRMDTIANNMANISTTGFKAENVQFESFFKQLKTDGKGVDFVYDVTSTTDFTQGALQQTNNKLDIAISGNGMIAAEGVDGTVFYTRDGRLSRNVEGVLVMTATGNPILDNSGSQIQIPEDITQISIANDGTISGNDQQISIMGVYNFDPLQVERREDGLYTMKNEPEIATNAKIHQGFIEGSNVNAVKTLTEMIQVQRAYEAGKGLMDSEDQRIRNAISRLGQNQR